MVTVLRHKTWSGIAVSAVWQGELVLCAVWDKSNSITVTDCFIVWGEKKKRERAVLGKGRSWGKGGPGEGRSWVSLGRGGGGGSPVGF